MLIEEFPEISLEALKVLKRFPTIYLCEKTFSLYAATKIKYRNRVKAENDLILQVTSIEPQFKSIYIKLKVCLSVCLSVRYGNKTGDI